MYLSIALGIFCLYLSWQLHRQREERQDLTTQMERGYRFGAQERRELREALEAAHLSHRQEIAALNQARTAEVADLLQRIQAPEQAVTSHVADKAPPDPPPLNLEDDDALYRAAEERMQEFGALSG